MRKFILMLFLMLGVFIAVQASADVAPPAYALELIPTSGSDQTQVRMESETARMNIREGTSSDELGVVEVSALFTIKNLGTAIESMPVRFPP